MFEAKVKKIKKRFSSGLASQLKIPSKIIPKLNLYVVPSGCLYWYSGGVLHEYVLTGQSRI